MKLNLYKTSLVVVLWLLLSVHSRSEHFLKTCIPFISLKNYPEVQFFLLVNDFERSGVWQGIESNNPELLKNIEIEVIENKIKVKYFEFDFHQYLDENNIVFFVKYASLADLQSERKCKVKIDYNGFHNNHGDVFVFSGNTKKYISPYVSTTAGFEIQKRLVDYADLISLEDEKYLELLPPIEIKSQLMPPEVLAENGGPGWDEFSCKYKFSLEVSSVLNPQGHMIYHKENLWDYNEATTWAEGSRGDGTGEWIDFALAEKDKFDGSFFGSFVIINGYTRTENVYKWNSRAKTMICYWNQKPVFRVHLLDKPDPQRFMLTEFQDKIHPATFSNSDVLHFVIEEIYPGEKYKDLCISEFFPTCNP